MAPEEGRSRRDFLALASGLVLSPLLPATILAAGPGRTRPAGGGRGAVELPVPGRVSPADDRQGPVELAVPVPRVNGGMNLQPLRRFETDVGFAPPLIVPELVDVQVRQLYELGIQQARITLPFDSFGFGANVIAAIPYVRAARALGIDVLGIIGQFGFGFDLVQALSSRRLRRPILDAYLEIFAADVPPVAAGVVPGGISFQVLNEPSGILSIRPGEYVRVFLAPVYRHLKLARPDLVVVSAAPVGTLTGVQRLREMLFWGLERHCDRVAIHVYRRDAIPHFAQLLRKPTWVTESGAAGTANHLGWFTEVFAEMRARIPLIEQVYWFQLFDFAPDNFRLVEIFRQGEGFALRAESVALVGHLEEQVGRALAGRDAIPYRQLVPDITRYFPTQRDLEIVASVPTA